MVEAADELFLSFLAQHDDATWLRLIDRLDGAMHPVDRVATRLWFHFYPLALDRAMVTAADPAAAARKRQLRGRWRLSDQVDQSHAFLYGHRYWPAVRTAVLGYARRAAAPASLDLATQIQSVAAEVARAQAVDPSLLVGIVAIGFRTLQQAGFDALDEASGTGEPPLPQSADAVVTQRTRSDAPGWFGFLRGRREWTVRFSERDPDASFPIIDSQHITTAAALDGRDYRSRDPRCSEGPIPVHCRSCSCGTCWIGVLAGAEKLSPMDARERAKLAELGYIETDEERPPIRLACMAQAFGSVSIVIPPWHGRLRPVRAEKPSGDQEP